MTTPYNINAVLSRSPEGLAFGKVAQWVDYSDFTDNADTTGDLTMNQQIPAGSFMLGTRVKVTQAFAGDTSAVVTVGKTAGEDEFSDGTSINVFTTGEKGDSPEDPLEFIAAAQSVVLRLTSAADFGAVTAGKMLVEVFYLTVDKDYGRGYPSQAQDRR